MTTIKVKIMCKFADLQIDSIYTLSLIKIACYDCGYMLNDETTELKYKGHVIHDDLTCDKFEYIHSKACPNCGDVKKYFMMICEDNLSLEIGYKMELPIDHNIRNQ